MKEGSQEEVLRVLEGVFGERVKRGPIREGEPGDAIASVLPTSAEEVELLAEVAERYSTSLVALGGETAYPTRRRGAS